MGPTPAGVPVVTTSPASRVIPAEMNASRRGSGNTWSLVRPSCFTTPFTRHCTRRSDQSRPALTQGPTGQKVSNPFARVHCPSARWMSRAVTSLRQVTPATALAHSASEARLRRLPMITASSDS